MKKALLMVLLLTSGCWTMKEEPEFKAFSGAHPDQLEKKAVVHKKATTVIKSEAEKIRTTATTPENKRSAVIIIEETAKIVEIAEILQVEAKAKTHYAKTYSDLKVKYVELDKKYNNGFAKVSTFLKILGAILIAAGAVLAFKLSPDFIIVSLFGIALIISTSIVKLLEKYGVWLAGIALICIGYLVWRMYSVQRKSVVSAVGVGEALKEIAKKKSSNEVKQLFGEGTIPGTITQDATTKKQIKSARKEILKDAKPLKDSV